MILSLILIICTLIISGGIIKLSDIKIKHSLYLANSKTKEFLKNWLNLNRWAIFLFIILISLSAILYVKNVRALTNQLKEIRQLERMEKSLSNGNKIINSRIKQLESPERIIKIAEEKLNMEISLKAPKRLSPENK